MKMNFPEEGQTDTQHLKKGETVTVVGASTGRGHLLVEHKGQSYHVPFQYMELISSNSNGNANAGGGVTATLGAIPAGQGTGVKI